MQRKVVILISLVLAGIFFSSKVSARDNVSLSLKLFPVISFGFGHAQAQVIPNTDDQFFDDNGLSLGIGIGIEKPLAQPLALTARLDLFNSFNFSSFIGSATASWGGLVSAGVIIGNARRPGQVFLSASLGFGFAALSDEPKDEDGSLICFLCSGREGGVSSGVAGRLAIGYALRDGSRAEIVWMRVGGDGDDDVYTNDEEAFIDAIQLQATAFLD